MLKAGYDRGQLDGIEWTGKRVSSEAEHVLASLRQQGERITIQRREVIEALSRDGGHLAIDDLHGALVRRGLDLNEPTIYRILQWLKDLCVVSQTDLGGNRVVYQMIGESRHHHLVCLNCHRVIEMDDRLLDDLRARLRQDYGFEPRIDHMAFFGLCSDCQAALETHT
ncbi:Fur family transcriptional regulator [Aggregatilinea lenta]|uniref:Fur family transcriptional regulator n=1 Tax=Aggregatilinea lenta TaxID=913108 RepID=UPI0013C31ABE|nr:Fur family transcriptional regulator [Aggregatilinea lenta]